MADTSERDANQSEQLRDLVAECIVRIEDEGSAAIERFCSEHPLEASAIRRRLQQLHAAGLLELSTPPERIPERLGDFRLLCRIGSGGMGVVYLAVQESLGREVAVKLIRPDHLYFPGTRERFRREVEAVARLDDPGIVPIHTVGEESGIPYFSMDYVIGATLAELVSELRPMGPERLVGASLLRAVAARKGTGVPEQVPPLFEGSWVQACCRVVQSVARSVSHAHERGVLHRDIKPSNVMITPAGRVLLLDFGLAAARGTDRLTRTGAHLGTLHYMPPEQLTGGAVDERSDVYALGAVLYELLALHPPFESADSEQLRAAILGGSLAKIARSNPGVPADAETICRCALDRGPARRYASASALADDLQRFLELRPILARRAGPALRVLRWTQRHRWRAAALALLVLGAAAAPAAVLWRSAAAAHARDNLREALRSVDQMLKGVEASGLAHVPGADSARRALFEQAVTRLAELKHGNPDDAAVATQLATTKARTAMIRRQLGDNAAAEAGLVEAMHELDALRARFPDDPEPAAGAGAVCLHLASLASERGERDRAASTWRRGVEILQPLAERDVPGTRSNLAACHRSLGLLALLRNDPAGGIAEMRLAVDLYQRAHDAAADDVDAIRGLAGARRVLADALSRAGEHEPAERETGTAKGLLEELLRREPHDVQARHDLAAIVHVLAGAADRHGDRELARRRLAEAQVTFGALVRDFPERTDYRAEHNAVRLQLADSARRAGEAAESEAMLRAVIADQEELVSGSPQMATWREELGSMCQILATVLEAKDLAQALPHQQRAYEVYAALAREHPDSVAYRVGCGAALFCLARHDANAGELPRALQQLADAAAEFRAALAAGGDAQRIKRHLQVALLTAARGSAATGDPAAAVERLREAAESTGMSAADVGAFATKLGLDGREDLKKLSDARAR